MKRWLKWIGIGFVVFVAVSYGLLKYYQRFTFTITNETAEVIKGGELLVGYAFTEEKDGVVAITRKDGIQERIPVDELPSKQATQVFYRGVLARGDEVMFAYQDAKGQERLVPVNLGYIDENEKTSGEYELHVK